MSLRIGHLSTFYHTSILMTAANTMGPETEWKLFGTGPAIVHAFEKAEIDLAYIGLPPAIIGIDRGVDIKCVAGGHVEGTVISGGGQFRGFPEIPALNEILTQFTGLKIGVPGRGSIHDVIISEMLRRYGLDNDIQIINFKWADEILEAIYKGEVSAAVGTPALAVAIKHFAGGKILCPPSKIWPYNPSYGIVVHNAFLDKNRETVMGFLIRHEEASASLRDDPAGAAKIISGHVGIVDQDYVLDVLNVSPRYCACLSDEYISATMEFVRTLHELGYIKRPISSGEIFDKSLIDAVHPERDHYGDTVSLP
ncbi:MAG: ABC transporter substrate-binding protein [Nitrospirota bacterium]